MPLAACLIEHGPDRSEINATYTESRGAPRLAVIRAPKAALEAEHATAERARAQDNARGREDDDEQAAAAAGAAVPDGAQRVFHLAQPLPHMLTGLETSLHQARIASTAKNSALG